MSLRLYAKILPKPNEESFVVCVCFLKAASRQGYHSSIFVNRWWVVRKQVPNKSINKSGASVFLIRITPQHPLFTSNSNEAQFAKQTTYLQLHFIYSCI